MYLIGSSCHQHNLLKLFRTDQAFGICRGEVLCTKLDKNGSIISTGVAFYSGARRPRNLIKFKHLISSSIRDQFQL